MSNRQPSQTDKQYLYDMVMSCSSLVAPAVIVLYYRPGANFYSELTESSSDFKDHDTQQMMSTAQRLAETVRSNIPSLKELAAKGIMVLNQLSFFYLRYN